MISDYIIKMEINQNHNGLNKPHTSYCLLAVQQKQRSVEILRVIRLMVKFQDFDAMRENVARFYMVNCNLFRIIGWPRRDFMPPPIY